MKIEVDPNKRPVKVKVRRYPPEQRLFLDKYINRLVELGFLVPNPNATWQAAPHLVPKDSKAMFRTTIDLRPLNSATVPVSWPMPYIEVELQDFKGSKCFASIDFCSGYWQLLIEPESQQLCGIICPKGVFSATRVLHGLKNATAHFTASVEPLFAELRRWMKSWVDDFILHAENEDELIDKIERFIEIAQEANLILSATKCNFFANSIRWCRRIIDGSGYKMDPRNMEGLQEMSEPKTAGELSELLH